MRHARAVAPDDLGRRAQQQGPRRAQRREGDQANVRLGADFSAVALAGVEGERDAGADERAALPQRHPDADVLAPLGALRVADGDGALAGPQERAADAAEPGAEEEEPLVAEPVVAVEPRRVRRVEGGAQHEGPPGGDAVGDAAGDGAADRHEPVGQGIGGVVEDGLDRGKNAVGVSKVTYGGRKGVVSHNMGDLQNVIDGRKPGKLSWGGGVCLHWPVLLRPGYSGPSICPAQRD